MPQFSAFTPFGLFQFSGAASDADNIYNTLKSQLSASFDMSQGTYEEAKVYAMSMQMAWARAIIKRVPREMHPLTCYDLLTTLEKDWACVPSATDTLFQRQSRIAARKLLMRGSREEAIVTDLIAAIGSDFIKLNACPVGSAANFPITPTTAGTFPLPALAPKFYVALDSVATLALRPSIRVLCINASPAPLVNEKLTIEPNIIGNSEAFTVQTVTATPGNTATFAITPSAFFTKSHSIGAWLMTAAPTWLSNRMQLQVVISATASTNAEKRRQANEVMARHCRSIERWKLVAASNSTQVGPFVFGVGHNRIGATALGTTATNF